MLGKIQDFRRILKILTGEFSKLAIASSEQEWYVESPLQASNEQEWHIEYLYFHKIIKSEGHQMGQWDEHVCWRMDKGWAEAAAFTLHKLKCSGYDFREGYEGKRGFIQ